MAQRFFTSMAVSDIIILIRSKRPPPGYSFIGEINNHTICVKFSPIPNAKQMTSPSSYNQIASSSSSRIVPPLPPRPNSMSNNLSSLEQSYVHVNSPSEVVVTPNGSNDFYNSLSRNGYQNHHHNVYNPLQGVPFELNPMYNLKRTHNDNLVRENPFFKII